jgi:aryl-alcohol dehydrogenase-like predicted oxidoreductase
MKIDTRSTVYTMKNEDEHIQNGQPPGNRLISRREFGAGLLGALPLFLGISGLSPFWGSEGIPFAHADEEPEMSMRRFANLGFKISSLSYNAANLANTGWQPLGHALDRGFTFVDTSPAYEKSEEIIGDNFFGKREKVMFCSKWITDGTVSRDTLLDSFEKSRARLKTKYIDVMAIDNVTTTVQLTSVGVREAFSRLKQDNRVRYMGMVCRGNYLDILKETLRTGGIDIILLDYTLDNFRDVRPYIEALGRRGVGIIVTRTIESSLSNPSLAKRLFGRRKQTVVQSTVEWVLGDRWISSLLCAPLTVDEVEEYIRYAAEED